MWDTGSRRYRSEKERLSFSQRVVPLQAGGNRSANGRFPTVFKHADAFKRSDTAAFA